FSMPLIAVGSIDQFGSTYPLAFALVYAETKDFYCWLALMAAISTVFSNTKHQLCTWHIFKNIRNKLKGIHIDEFVQAVRRLMYDDLSEHQTNKEITELWTRFPNTK
ncbi:5757_t:CDS:2, partial [Racocetra persica]